MSVEFREWNGLRITFFAGASEPVWLMAEIARTAAGPRNNLQTTIPPPWPGTAGLPGLNNPTEHAVPATLITVPKRYSAQCHPFSIPVRPLRPHGEFTHPRACSTNGVVAGFAAIHPLL